MLAYYTPQSLMEMKMVNNRWQFKTMESSKTLDHYEKYGIHEIHRSPMHLNNEALTTEMLQNEQVHHLVKQGVEMMRVNVGAYISILCHIESINAQSH
jgi:hypothetical protein